ncbi:MAG: COG4315 family predicted lipoprotein, partial [Solirubrobacteraceae bacterium]
SSTYGGSPAAPAASNQAAGAGARALVKTAANSSLGGAVLVDGRGMTLYALSAERAGRFICASSACTSIWHPLAASGAPSGSVGSLGTVKRPDGSEQVTYAGKPLYTFGRDTSPGQVGGQGIKDVGTWSAIRVGASPATSAGSSGSGSTGGAGTSGSGSSGGEAAGGYHY